MLRGVFSCFIAVMVAVTLSFGTANAIGMSCCEESQQMEGMPCHDDGSGHQQSTPECCLDALCSKCLNNSAGLMRSTTLNVFASGNQPFMYYQNIVPDHYSKAPERPPKVLG